jgi:putative DNA primase/helicase
MIPFEEKIPDEERIDQAILLGIFEEELPGIFNWEIEGLKKFQKDGLKDIPAVSKAVADFKTDQDRLHFFIEDCLYIPKEKEVLVAREVSVPEK